MKRGILLIASLFAATAAAGPVEPAAYADLQWRFIGPDGNRVIAVIGEPGNPKVYYAGAASGGIFKSTDAGNKWEPIFDGQESLSIGALALAPSDPAVLWAGTGETFIRSNISIGNGVYRSTDAGKTWAHKGLMQSGRIGRIVVDPRNPNVVFVAAQGHSYGPQQERGLFRTRDGGGTWEKVLFVDDNTGCIDVAIDPQHPDTLYAAMWQLVIHPWGRESGGPGSAIFKSVDGGSTWRRLSGNGLPDGPLGKIGLAVAPSNPDRVYALIETADPGLYRSDDRGEHWTLASQDHDYMERPHYYTRLSVAPDDEDRIYVVCVRFTMSRDGGETKAKDSPRAGGDLHDIWIDPTDAQRMMVGDDGGVGISVNRGRTWKRVSLPIAQMYHAFTDDQIPYNVYGNRQDGYSYRGPSRSRMGRRIPLSLWHAVGGCESGFAVPDPFDNNIVWSGCYDGGLERFDLRTMQSRAVEVWPEAAYGVPSKDVRYRFQWTFPIAISPHDHNTVFVGSQSVHRTTDGGQSWQTISPDLTTNDRSKQEASGGLVKDVLMVENACVIFAIAESPLAKGLIWTGSMDGLVHVTRDGGRTWTNVTANIKGMPPWGAISNIEPSRFDAGTAYISVDRHQMNDRDPYIFKTTDYGTSWTRVSAGIPRSVFAYIHVVREDPVRRGMLYAGTENGVYFTLDDGASWNSLQNNLPHAPVHWLTVQERFSDLVAATYGRGFWILDDVTPLRQIDKTAASAQTTLLPPRPAYRFRPIQNRLSMPDAPSGQNPPEGAAIHVYWPKEGRTRGIAPAKAAPDDEEEGPPSPDASTEGGGGATLTVEDGAGRTIRTLRGISLRRGLNRLVWDLRHDPPATAKLRVPPPGHAHVRIGSSGWRPLVTWDLDLRRGQVGPLALPGTYTVKLEVEGKTVSEKLVVLKDPNTAGTDEDVRLQHERGLMIRDDMNAVVALINDLEWVRKQIADLLGRWAESAGGSSSDALAEQAKAVAAKALSIESVLYDVNLTGAREDAFRTPNQIYEKLSSVSSDVSASSADFRPTDAQVAVHEMLRGQIAEARRRYDAFVAEDLAAFNRAAGDAGLAGIGPAEP